MAFSVTMPVGNLPPQTKVTMVKNMCLSVSEQDYTLKNEFKWQCKESLQSSEAETGNSSSRNTTAVNTNTINMVGKRSGNRAGDESAISNNVTKQ